MVSNELLAEATSKPRTKAARVAIMPATTFTVSLDLSRRCGSGSRPLSDKPSKAPPKMQAALIKKIICEFIVRQQMYKQRRTLAIGLKSYSQPNRSRGLFISTVKLGQSLNLKKSDTTTSQ